MRNYRISNRKRESPAESILHPISSLLKEICGHILSCIGQTGPKAAHGYVCTDTPYFYYKCLLELSGLY